MEIEKGKMRGTIKEQIESDIELLKEEGASVPFVLLKHSSLYIADEDDLDIRIVNDNQHPKFQYYIRSDHKEYPALRRRLVKDMKQKVR